MANVVIVNRKGVQMRQSNGRYAPKIVPPAVAASVGPRNITQRAPGPNGVVPVDRGTPRQSGEGIVQSSPVPPSAAYRVVK